MVASETLINLFRKIDEISPQPTGNLDKFFESDPHFGNLNN